MRFCQECQVFVNDTQLLECLKKLGHRIDWNKGYRKSKRELLVEQMLRTRKQNQLKLGEINGQ